MGVCTESDSSWEPCLSYSCSSLSHVKVHEVHRDSKVIWGHRGRQDPKVIRDHWGRRDPRVIWDHQGQRDHRGAPKVIRGHRGFQDYQDHQDQQGFRDYQGYQGITETRGQRDLQDSWLVRLSWLHRRALYLSHRRAKTGCAWLHGYLVLVTSLLSASP